MPQLVSLLRNRLLKAAARDVLVGYGPGVVDTLAYFLRDQDEDIWVRRHIPSTLARIPGQKTMDILVDALTEKRRVHPLQGDQAIGRMRLSHPELKLPVEKIHAAGRPGGQAVLHVSEPPLQPRARRQDRRETPCWRGRCTRSWSARSIAIFRLLGLIYPWKDIAAARWSLAERRPAHQGERGRVPRQHAGLRLRKRVMPVLEELPIEEKVQAAATCC